MKLVLTLAGSRIAELTFFGDSSVDRENPIAVGRDDLRDPAVERDGRAGVSRALRLDAAAYLADGRVELGVGVGWCEEEFDLMEQRFSARGRRTDEMLDLMRSLWSPDWTEFDGEFRRQCWRYCRR